MAECPLAQLAADNGIKAIHGDEGVYLINSTEYTNTFVDRCEAVKGEMISRGYKMGILEREFYSDQSPTSLSKELRYVMAIRGHECEKSKSKSSVTDVNVGRKQQQRRNINCCDIVIKALIAVGLSLLILGVYLHFFKMTSTT